MQVVDTKKLEELNHLNGVAAIRKAEHELAVAVFRHAIVGIVVEAGKPDSGVCLECGVIVSPTTKHTCEE